MLTRRTVVFLAFAAIALSSAAYFSKMRSADAGVAAPRTLLPDYRNRVVRRIAFVRDGVTNEIENVGGAWRFASGDFGRVAAMRVQEILGDVPGADVCDRVTARQRADRGLTLADYGLDPAAVTVKFTDASGDVTVNFGTNAVGAFASVDGRSDVCMVNRSVLELLPKSENDLRDRMPFALDDRIVDRFEIRRTGEPAIRIARVGPGSDWNMLSPMECVADSEIVEESLRAVVDADVEQYVSEPRLQSEETAVSLSLWYRGEPAPRAFAFGYPEKGGSAPVRVSSLTAGGEFLVRYQTFDAVCKPAGYFREHRLFSCLPGGVESVSARFADCSFKLLRSGDGWRFTHPFDHAADSAGVEAFVASLCALCDTNAVAVDAASGQPSGGVEITLGSADSGETFTFADGAAFSKKLRRELDVVAWPDLSRRTFFRLCSPYLFDANPDFKAECVESMSPADSAEYGLLPPAEEFSVCNVASNRAVSVVQLGLAGPDGSRFLRVKGDDVIFAVSSNTVEALRFKSKENKNELQSQEGR